MDYPEAMNFLERLTKFGVNLGLDRIKALLAAIGNPERDLKFIHIAGTNGKGSVAAMLAAILQAAGYSTGLYTSPHLVSYTERFQVNGQEIGPADMAALLTELKPQLEETVRAGQEQPTEFEVLTALGMLYFARRGVDIVVLEAGLGGSIDSTNVVTEPVVAVITNVGMDHLDYLGRSVAGIAQAKSGIIKPGCPAVTAARRKEALEVIGEHCRRLGVSLYRVGRDVTWQELSSDLTGQKINVQGLKWEYSELSIPLIGRHQQENAATAIATAEVAGERGFGRINPQAIRQGLSRVRWPARLEIVARKPLVVVDAAHNADGALVLRRAMEEVLPRQSLILLIGMLADKEREKVVATLAPLADTVVVTRPLSSRAGLWQALADEACKYCPDVEVIEDLDQAVVVSLARTPPEGTLLVTGSFYLVAAARAKIISSLASKSFTNNPEEF